MNGRETTAGRVRGLGDARYVVITPVRDEEEYIRFTLRSMIMQTLRPVEWVIVNDGSTDGTGEIIEGFAAAHSWIHVVHRANRGYRKAGGGVIDAFYEGFSALRSREWDFVVKLDGDLEFEETYFRDCLSCFRDDPQLGIAGGTIVHLIDGVRRDERVPEFHVRGATKIYRKACWDAIGGLLRAPGWDTLDEVKANMVGWTTRSFSDISILHHRFTGEADGMWKNFVKNGTANYICGYHPFFMLLKCARRLYKKPILIGSVALLYGFFRGYLCGVPQIEDKALMGYLRRQQLNRLMLRPSIWR